MKTISQIRKKTNQLKSNLSKKQIVENFGDKEIRKLESFIGDIYAYSYLDRLEINGITELFFNWCINYIRN